MHNIFTVDLEDWYCSRAMDGIIYRSQWSRMPSRVHVGTRILLNLLRQHRVSATFFVLGFVAEREPELICEIMEDGHEIASHGYHHHHLKELGPVRFADDLEKAIDVTTTITKTPIRGYRAPIFSVTQHTEAWATEVMSQLGIAYDSSVVPMRMHPEYGNRRAGLMPYRHDNGLLELPISCVDVAGVRVPASGGGYFRQLPYFVTASLARRCNADGRPMMFYIHPWELDVHQPRVSLSTIRHVRHYRGLDTTQAKLEQLLKDFRFGSVQSYIRNAGSELP